MLELNHAGIQKTDNVSHAMHWIHCSSLWADWHVAQLVVRPAHRLALLRSESPSGKCAKLHPVAPNSNKDHPTRSLSSSPRGSTVMSELFTTTRSTSIVGSHSPRIRDHSIAMTLLMLVHATYIWVLFFAYPPFVVNSTFNATPTERLQQYE